MQPTTDTTYSSKAKPTARSRSKSRQASQAESKARAKGKAASQAAANTTTSAATEPPATLPLDVITASIVDACNGDQDAAVDRLMDHVVKDPELVAKLLRRSCYELVRQIMIGRRSSIMRQQQAMTAASLRQGHRQHMADGLCKSRQALQIGLMQWPVPGAPPGVTMANATAEQLLQAEQTEVSIGSTRIRRGRFCGRVARDMPGKRQRSEQKLQQLWQQISGEQVAAQ